VVKIHDANGGSRAKQCRTIEEVDYKEARWKLALDLIGLTAVSWILLTRTDKLVPAVFVAVLTVATLIHVAVVRRHSALLNAPKALPAMTADEAYSALDNATSDARQRAAKALNRRRPRGAPMEPWYRVSMVIAWICYAAAMGFVFYGVFDSAVYIVTAVLLGCSLIIQIAAVLVKIVRRKRRTLPCYP
jgi:hypothetical protein